ncbi:MAG: hypothetical protein AAF907_00275 [Planctomycetota bacterium]
MTESKPPDAPNPQGQSPPQPPELEPLTERIADWRPESEAIDASARLIRGVALCGTESRNGYVYPESVLRAAAPLYEGAPVFLDHASAPPGPGLHAASQPASGTNRGRSARDYVGSVRSVRFENGRLRGDVAALETEAGRTFLALAAGDADDAAPRVGMSHVVLAERTPDGSEVTAIREVLSVDAVAFPATVSRLRESLSPGSKVQSGDSDSEAAPDRPPEPVRTELAEAKAEIARLREEAAALLRADELVEEVGLPDWAATPAFRKALASAASDADRRALAEDRRAVLERLRIARPAGSARESTLAGAFVSGPISRSRPAATGPDAGALLVQAVRGA